jgi:hypothetical protein
LVQQDRSAGRQRAEIWKMDYSGKQRRIHDPEVYLGGPEIQAFGNHGYESNFLESRPN